MACYWATCASGLQSQVVQELQKLNDLHVISDSLLHGGVAFSTTSSPAEISKLRSIDNICAFLGHFQDIPLKKDAALSCIKSLALKIDWEEPLDLFWRWKNFIEAPAVVAPKKMPGSSLSFRVTCARSSFYLKKHEFTSMDAAAALGEGIQQIFGWPADMCGYDLEVLLWIHDADSIVALALVNRGKQRNNRNTPSMLLGPGNAILMQQPTKLGKPSRADSQLYSWRPYRKVLVETSLKPSVAYALLQLGQVTPGTILLDPMCGCGTIPLEASDWLGQQVMCLAGDISSKASIAANDNAQASGLLGLCDTITWDAAVLPLRTGSIDRLVCDMPFGVRCGNARTRERICPKVVKEIVRVLRLGTGIVVLLSQGKAMRNEMENVQQPFLQLLHHFPIDMEGIRVEIFVAQRTLKVPPFPGR